MADLFVANEVAGTSWVMRAAAAKTATHSRLAPQIEFLFINIIDLFEHKSNG